MPIDAWSARRHRPSQDFDRVYLYHVRKTAGTSLANSFLALGGEDPSVVFHRMARRPHATRSGGLVFVHFERALLQHGSYLFGWSHHPSWYLTLPPRTFTVTVLRDPIERVLSLYRYLADPQPDAGLPFPAPEEDRRWAGDGFSTFLDRAPRTALCNQLHTFSRMLDPAEAADAVRGCHAYFFTDCYGEGLDALSRLLGLALARRVDRRSVPAPPPRPEELERLRRMLDAEYRFVDLLRADPGPHLLGGVSSLSA
jgi:hypothetical protein